MNDQEPGHTDNGRHGVTRALLRLLKLIAIVALGLTASWWVPRLSAETPAEPTPPDPPDPPEIEGPEGGDGEIPLPLGPDDLIGSPGGSRRLWRRWLKRSPVRR